MNIILNDIINMVLCMEINYSNNSFKSRIIKTLIKISGFKKNTSTISNTKKYISKCSKRKISKNTFKNMIKKIYNNYTIYTWNGTIEDCKDTFLLYIHGGSFIDKPLNIQIKFVKKIGKDYKFIQFDNQFHNFELYPIIESKKISKKIIFLLAPHLRKMN